MHFRIFFVRTIIEAPKDIQKYEIQENLQPGISLSTPPSPTKLFLSAKAPIKVVENVLQEFKRKK
jgi:hypothetical protein